MTLRYIALALVLLAVCLLLERPPSSRLSPLVVHAQTSTTLPDCALPIGEGGSSGGITQLAAIGTSTLFDNRSAGCVEWILTYTTYGWNTASIQVVDAPNNIGSPGTPVAFQGSVLNGLTQPVSASSSGLISVSGYYPYMGVAVTATTGTGSLHGTLYGWRLQPVAAAGQAAPTAVFVTQQGITGQYTGTGSTVMVLSATANTVITANTIYIGQLSCYNNTAGALTINRTDTAANKFETTLSVAANGSYHVSNVIPEKMVGLKMWASATPGVNCTIGATN